MECSYYKMLQMESVVGISCLLLYLRRYMDAGALVEELQWKERKNIRYLGKLLHSTLPSYNCKKYNEKYSSHSEWRVWGGRLLHTYDGYPTSGHSTYYKIWKPKVPTDNQNATKNCQYFFRFVCLFVVCFLLAAKLQPTSYSKQEGAVVIVE